MKEERQAFSARLADAMRKAGHVPRPSVLLTLFNTRYRGKSVSFQTASRWLKGRSMPEQDKLLVLAKELGVEPHALRFGVPAKRGVAEPRPAWFIGLDDEDREAMHAFVALPAVRKRLIRDLIVALRG